MKRLIALGDDKRSMVPALEAKWFKLYDNRGETAFIEADKEGWQKRAAEFIPLLCKSVGAKGFQAKEIPNELIAALCRSDVGVIVDTTTVAGGDYMKPVETPEELGYGVPYRRAKGTVSYDLPGLEKMWTEHVAPHLAVGQDVIVWPEIRGVYIQIHWDREENSFEVFDATGRNRKTDFPGLNEVLPRLRCEECIIEGIATAYSGDEVRNPRESFWHGDVRVGRSAHYVIYMDDALMVDGKSLARQPRIERVVSIYRMFMDSSAGFVGMNYTILPVPAKIVRQGATFEDFRAAADTKIESPGPHILSPPKTNGAFIAADEQTRDGNDSGIFVNRVRMVISAEVIGTRIVPERPLAKEWWSEATAKARLDELRDAGRFIDVRVAIPLKEGSDRLTPLLVHGKALTGSSFKMKWDEEEQDWKGGFDPAEWAMAKGFARLGSPEEMALRHAIIRVPRTFRPVSVGDKINIAIGSALPWSWGEYESYLYVDHGAEFVADAQGDALGTAEAIMKAQDLKPANYKLASKERRRSVMRRLRRRVSNE